jgi:hypothetical protein
MMHKRKIRGARLLVIAFAVLTYLILLPVSFNGGISFPHLINISGDRLVEPNPIYLNYFYLIPIVLFIIFIGFEYIRLREGSPKK